MLPIVLALFSALGFAAAAIFARVGIQDIKPIPSTLISALASFIPTALLALIFALSTTLMATYTALWIRNRTPHFS